MSGPTARAMAEGVRRLTCAGLALSVTGVAGPDRDDRGHDVGTVYIALSAKNETTVQLLHLSGGRNAIRAAAKAAGQSVQAYVLQACEERMKREGRPLELDSPADE